MLEKNEFVFHIVDTYGYKAGTAAFTPAIELYDREIVPLIKANSLKQKARSN